MPVLFNVLTSLANSYLFRSPCHFLEETIIVKMNYTGGSPGLVVMGGDLCSEGRDFESQHHILDGHFSHLFVVKILMFV